MSRGLLTAVLWAATLLSLIVGGLIAAVFVVMPTSLGPSEMIEGGTDPWVTALIAAAAFVGLVVVAVAGLILSHSVRLRAIGIALVVAEVASVAWAAAKVYSDYF